MHEMGIILHLARTLDETAEAEKLQKISQVTLQVGEVSGIMTELFCDCWDYFKVRYPVISESQLKIEVLKAVTHCDDCSCEYETVKYGRICPKCGSEHTWLLTGNECIIKQVEAEEEVETGS